MAKNIFTGGKDFTGFKKMAHEVLMKNELNDGQGAYEIQHARLGESGWSFGPPQWDLKNNIASRSVFKSILNNAKDNLGNALFDSTKVEALYSAAITNAELSAQQKSDINHALGSSYGRATIHAEYSVYLDKKIQKLDELINKLPDDIDKAYLTKDFSKLVLLDFDNQYGLDTKPPGDMLKYLQGGEAKFHLGVFQKEGNFNLDDLLKPLFSTKYFANNPHDPMRRLNSIWGVAKANGVAPIVDQDNAKGIVDIFLKHILPHSHKLNSSIKLEHLYNLHHRAIIPAYEVVYSAPGVPPVDNSRSPIINVVPDPQVKKQIKGEDQAAQDVQQGYAYKTPTTSIQFTKGELESSLFTDTQRASAATNGVRPGAFQLDPNPEPAQWLAKHAHPDPAINAAVYGSLAAGATQQTFVDPLVLDLNGDGVKLTHYKIDPVFFDIDHDGYLEQTGWTSKEDGILVVDLNNNGKIDNMSETLSEYYAGAVGINGNEGEKKYKNGFEALSTLDSNNDGIFNANDQAWQTVRVWVDSNHDGKNWDDVNRNNQIDTDESSELKTLDELGVSAIDLHTQVQGNETRNGNEVLARSTFTRTSIDDQTARQQTATREVIAARFLANPVGHTFTEQGQGLVISTQKKEDSISTRNHEALIPIVLESGFSIKGENISINTHKTSLIIIGKNIVKEEIINGFQHITIRTEEETHYRNNENQSNQISNASYTPIKTNFVTKNTIPSLMNKNSILPTVDALIEESAKIIPPSAGQTAMLSEYRNNIAPAIAVN